MINSIKRNLQLYHIGLFSISQKTGWLKILKIFNGLLYILSKVYSKKSEISNVLDLITTSTRYFPHISWNRFAAVCVYMR